MEQNAQKIEELMDRGVVAVYPNKEFLASRLNSGKRLKIYMGIDPTGPTLHLGHMIAVKKLKAFQDLGHEVVLLMGDFTAMIGDPTDKLATRKQLTRKEILQNLKLYKKQASVFLNFSGRNKARVAYNSKWFGKMRFEDVLSLASKMTVQQMLERDMFEKRILEGKPIYIHEFMYPLMQGYDSVALDVDGEIGGNDQTFNMLAGRTLMKSMKEKEKFVISMKLLEDNSGKKMGKTEGNMVSLIDSPSDMFGKVMSWADGLIVPGFELCTDVSMEEIEKVKNDLENGFGNPRDSKIKLAYEIVKIFQGEKNAKEAEANFINTFQKGEIPEDMEEYKAIAGEELMNIALDKGIIKSKSEWRRLIDEGAVTELVGEYRYEIHDSGAYPIDNKKIDDPHYKISAGGTFKIGKRRFIKIIL